MSTKPSEQLRVAFVEECEKKQRAGKTNAVHSDHALMLAVGRVLDGMLSALAGKEGR